MWLILERGLVINFSEGFSYDDLLLRPQTSVLDSRADADISTELFQGVPMEIPIVAANMPAVVGKRMAVAMREAGGYAVAHRFDDYEQRLNEYDDVYKDVVFSLGVKDGISEAIDLFSYGANMFCLDIAHGDSTQTEKFIKRFRRLLGDSPKLMIGNFAGTGILRLPLELVDAIKVGIGPGAACTTRSITGFGVPQITSIDIVVEALKYAGETRIKVVADGGIKNSGDIVKALAAGADSVMVGRLLAGADEAPNGLEYFGNASGRVNGHRAPEGAEGLVDATGPAADTLKSLCWGIRSGISYGGGRNIKELHQLARWIKVEHGTVLESSVRI